MKQKYYLLNEICDILQISPDMIYRWGTICPELQAQVQNEKGRFTAWDLELLKYSKRAIAVYDTDSTSIRTAIVQWINTNPKPLENPDYESLQYQTDMPQTIVPQSITQIWQQDLTQGKIGHSIYEQHSFDDEIDTQLNLHLPSEIQSQQQMLQQMLQVQQLPQVQQQVSSIQSEQIQVKSSSPDLSMTMPIKEIKEKMNTHPNQNHMANQLKEEEGTDVAAWKKAFNSSQLELTQLRADLSKARETIHLQQTNLKQVATEFNALKELIRKEIYNLRDLVVDK